MNSDTPKERSPLAVIAKRLVYAAIVLITLIALVYAEENFRGKRAWENYRKGAEARGTMLDFAAMIPPMIPDDQNGAITPHIQSWFPKPRLDGTNDWPALFSQADRLVVIKWRTKGIAGQDDRSIKDLTAWEEAFAKVNEGDTKTNIKRESHSAPLDPQEQAKAARAILDELKIYEPVLNELRVASQRPHVRYPIEYKLDEPFAILLPHLAKTKGIVQELKLQASAELVANETNRAFADVRLMLWFANSMKDEGFLISQLVRIAEQQIAILPIWEGLTQHKWSEVQLKEMQEWFLRVNFAESLTASMNSERAAGIAISQNIIKRGNLDEMLATADADGGAPQNSSRHLLQWTIPRGWIYFEMVNHSSMMDGLIANGWASDKRIFYPRVLDANENQFASGLHSGFAAVVKHHVLARLLLPALTKSALKFSRAQSTANQVALACALERFHQAKNTYPKSLSELVPQFIGLIPNEVVSEEPMRYLRTDGGYVLYSVGWDGVDDGGALLRAINGKPETIAPATGDWVWRIGE